jgi:hypothetical protein
MKLYMASWAEMNKQYRHNHYVPVWYQRRFMPPGQHRYYRLDLKPDVVEKGKVKYTRNALHHCGPDLVFAEDDLYTTQWGNISNTEIERFFFGRLDNEGPGAIDYFCNFEHPCVDPKAFNQLLPYMSVQKLRTPKGLAVFAAEANSTDKNDTLLLLQRMQNMYCAIWTESVWQIADASGSATKFIISDHPVTVYKRACPHLSKWCLGPNDPDIRFHATHTYFPLSLDKVLILTNLSWVRNPYQNEIRTRPNPRLLRDAMFNFTAIQTDRKLEKDPVSRLSTGEGFAKSCRLCLFFRAEPSVRVFRAVIAATTLQMIDTPVPSQSRPHGNLSLDRASWRHVGVIRE